MNEKKQIVNDAGFYSILNYTSGLIGFFIGIVVRRILDPALMGIWVMLKTVLGYCLYGTMGIGGALFKEVPLLVGKGRKDLAEETVDIVFNFSLWAGLVIGLVVAIAAFLMSKSFSRVVIAGLFVIALLVPLTLVYNFFTITCRAYKKFVFLTALSILHEIFTLIFVLLFAVKWGIYGIFTATVLSLIASIAIAVYYLKPRLRIRSNFKRLAYLIRLGISLLFWGLALTTLLSVDKIMAIRLLGAEALGFYSIAIMIFTFAFGASKRFGTVLFPRLQEGYGRSDSAHALEKYVFKTNVILSYLLPVFLGFFYFFVPVLVYYVLPKYIDGVSSFKILMPGCFFMSLTPVLYSFLIAINRQLRLAFTALLSAVFMVFLSILFVRGFGMSINGIALAASASYTIFYVALAAYSSFYLGKVSKFIPHIKNVLVPFGVSFFFIFILDYYVRIGNIIGQYALKQTLFLLSVLPLVVYINKKTGVINEIKGYFLSSVLRKA